jgi:hypothetical protein
MPIFTPGASTPICSGTRSSAVFQNTAAGRIFRARIKPLKKHPSTVNDTRAQFLYAASNWRTLTPTIQADWNTAAEGYTYFDSCGLPYTITGQMLFIKSAKRLAERGLSFPPIAPNVVSISTVDITSISFSLVLPVLRPNTSPGVVPSDVVLKIFATPPISASIASINPGLFKLYKIFPPSSPANYNFYTEYTAENPTWQSLTDVQIVIRCEYEDVAFAVLSETSTLPLFL